MEKRTANRRKCPKCGNRLCYWSPEFPQLFSGINKIEVHCSNCDAIGYVDIRIAEVRGSYNPYDQEE